MALPKSGTSGSNVLKLDEVRRRRSKPQPAESAGAVADSKTTEKPAAEAENNDAPSASQTRRRSDKQASSASQGEAQQADTVKTPAKRSRVSNRRFDKVKVDRIKEEIAQGDYSIDYLQVADKFIEHERYS